MNRALIAMLSVSAVLPAAAACAAAAEKKPYTRNVAIVLYENVQPLDWTGPYEVYNDAGRFGEANGEPAFNVYTVSKTAEPLNGQGLKIVPTYSIENAPRPDIVVFPGGPSDKIYSDPVFFEWASRVSKDAEIAQSVCTGAFVLAKAGLLDGLEVTTFFGAIDSLQRDYPKVMVKNGRRFVDNGRVVTTAGISAGIDGSLHVVARLLGRRVADQVARYMEYHWSPEAFLSVEYSYLNPSTDARGRLAQTAEMQLDAKSYADAEATYRSMLASDAGNAEAWGGLGLALRAQKQHAQAGEALARSVAGRTDGHAAWVLYSAAVQYALGGRKAEARATLDKAFASGYPNKDAIEKDPDLASLRADGGVKDVTTN
jgi:putative intracellular protease/amidase